MDSNSNFGIDLVRSKRAHVLQVHEVFEWIGFETRNKYYIYDENEKPIGIAAEQGKGFFGFFFRQLLGHWRKFDVHFYSTSRQLAFTAHHPFRWFFQRFEIKDTNGKLMGAVQKRFSLFTKRFDVENSKGMVIMEVASPVWRIWTFKFMHLGQTLAIVKKQWSGLFAEGFTDKDNFLVEFTSPQLNEEERLIILASTVFIDLLYFERKQ